MCSSTFSALVGSYLVWQVSQIVSSTLAPPSEVFSPGHPFGRRRGPTTPSIGPLQDRREPQAGGRPDLRVGSGAEAVSIACPVLAVRGWGDRSLEDARADHYGPSRLNAHRHGQRRLRCGRAGLARRLLTTRWFL